MDKPDIIDCLKVYVLNGTAIGFISISEVKDIVALALGIVSTVSTLIIIRNNLLRNKEK